MPDPPTNLDEVNLPDEDGTVPQPEDGSSSSDVEVDEPQLFSQEELNDLVRDLDLPKQSAELLGSRLKSKNLLMEGTSFAWYRHREKDFMSFS